MVGRTPSKVFLGGSKFEYILLNVKQIVLDSLLTF